MCFTGSPYHLGKPCDAPDNPAVLEPRGVGPLAAFQPCGQMPPRQLVETVLLLKKIQCFPVTHGLLSCTMEPFSALAVATSVVQFVDFGAKLITHAFEIHSSASGLPDEYADLDDLNKKMIATNEALDNSLQPSISRPLQPHEQELLSMCKQCQDISRQLSAALAKIQKSSGCKTWGSLRAAFASLLGQQKIQSLQARLESFRQQLMLNVLVTLR